ncbi:hypothetical protein [Streptomyces sp. NPDC002785]|uniref:hypothetical protein n=1 Tax=Streptomyces sp. NPDC002785 TaxID=3154543 RepID=UPI003321E586
MDHHRGRYARVDHGQAARRQVLVERGLDADLEAVETREVAATVRVDDQRRALPEYQAL